MKGHRVIYSAKDLAWLKANAGMVIADYHAAFVAVSGREDVSIDNLKSLRTRKGWKTGRTGTFARGAVPHNKGKRCEPGYMGRHPNAAKTQFKKGTRTGVAARNYKPIGSERVSKEGYLERKVNDDLPMQARWKSVHRINWEAVNGPVPKGMFLKCLNANIADTDPSNWALLSRAMLPRLAGGRHANHIPYDTAPAELKPAILAVAKLEHMARQKHRGAN